MKYNVDEFSFYNCHFRQLCVGKFCILILGRGKALWACY